MIIAVMHIDYLPLLHPRVISVPKFSDVRINNNRSNFLLFSTDANCTYFFHATPNEQVTIVFDHFKVKADGANVTTGGAYG